MPKNYEYDLWLLGVYLFNFFDILTTYLVLSNVSNSFELNPVVIFGGFSLLIFLKIFVPFLLYLYSKKRKTLLPLQLLFGIFVFVSFYNLNYLLGSL